LKQLKKKIDKKILSVKQEIILSKENSIEIAIFYRDFSRCLHQFDFKGIFQWLFNYKKYLAIYPFL
jgi:hypothetical protein